MLDPEGVGRVGFIDSFTYYFITIAEFGIAVYGIREIAKEKNHRKRLSELVSELITLHLITTACVIVIYAVSVFVLWNRIGDLRLLFFSLSFLLVNAFSCEWYFWGTERFSFITIRSLIVRLLGLASIFLLIKQESDYHIYYGIIAGSAIVTSLWNNVILFHEIRFSVRKINWKRHLKYVWVTYLISILYSVPLMLDNVLLRMVNTPTAVGLYAFSVKIVRMSSILLTDSFLVFFPRIVTLVKQNEAEQLQQKLRLNIQFVILLSVPMGMGLSLISDELTTVFLGNKFLPVADNIRLLAFFPLLKAVSLFLSNPILIAHHKEKVFLNILVAGTVLFTVAMLILGHYYGDTGACLALLIVEIFVLIANYIAVKKHLPKLQIFDLRTIKNAILGSLLFIPVVYLVKWQLNSDLSRLISAMVGCFIVYVLYLLLIAKSNFVLHAKKTLIQYFLKKAG